MNDNRVVEINNQGKLAMHDFVKSLLQSTYNDGKKSSPFHFFEQDYTFICFEYQALYIADEFYKTRYAVRLEYGLDSLSLSKKFFRTVCAQLLVSNDVHIWGKRSNEVNSPYELLAKGGPGNIRSVEDIVGAFGEYETMGDYIAVIHVDTRSLSHSFSFAYFNDSDYHLSVRNIHDDAEYTKLKSIASQFAISNCIMVETISSIKTLGRKCKLSSSLLSESAGNDPNESAEHLETIDDDDDISTDELSLKRAISVLENELNVFVDIVSVKPVFTEKDRLNIVAEIVDMINPLGFVDSSSSNLASPDVRDKNDSEFERVQRLNSLDAAFRENIGALLVANTALRRQQRVEKLRHRDSSTSFQVPISFSVLADDEECHKILLLDQSVISSLQLLPEGNNNSGPSAASATSSKRGSQTLFRVLDRTCTTMGRRLLRTWIQRPSCHLATITSRQQSISFFMRNSRLLANLRESAENFKYFPDLEKILQRLRPSPSLKTISATGNRELRDLLEIFKCISRVKNICSTIATHSMSSTSASSAAIFGETSPSTNIFVDDLKLMCEKCTPLLSLVEEIIDAEHLQASYARSNSAIESSSSTKEGEWLFRSRFLRIKPTLTVELASCHQRLEETTQDILKHVATLPTVVGVEKKELHLERSDVHGIHLRVTKRISNKVLKALDSQKVIYRVLSQQKAGALFLTKPLENLLQTYESRKQAYESAQLVIVLEALKVARTYLGLLQSITDKLATIDTLMSLASVALSYDWTIPTVYIPSNDINAKDNRKVLLKGLYHPLLRDRLGASQVVASNLTIEPPCLARNIFGPNMGGKSTFLKAVGTTAILAQMGSAVPCESANLPLFDRIFLRTGSAESAALGMSSFLAEMNAMAEVLRLATSNSLVLIDEIGRGTSTADGFGLAWSILEELSLSNRSIVLCATHFHELSRLETEVLHLDSRPAFASLHVDALVNTAARDIQMLYKILPGGSNKSYGIHCAQVAGFPEEIVQNALAIEATIENGNSKVQYLEEDSHDEVSHKRPRESHDSDSENEQNTPKRSRDT